MSRRCQIEPRLLDFGGDFDGCDHPGGQICFQVVQSRRTTSPIDDTYWTEDPFETITRPLLEPVEMLIVQPFRHTCQLA